MKKLFIMLMLLMLLVFPVRSRAQITYVLSNSIPAGGAVAASATSNAPATFLTNSANWFRLRSNQGLAIQCSCVGTNVAATNGPVLFGFNLSLDGTNFTTGGLVSGQAFPIQISCPAFGNTNTFVWTNLALGALNNTRYIRLDQIANNNTNVVIPTVTVGYFPNNGTFYSQ